MTEHMLIHNDDLVERTEADLLTQDGRRPRVLAFVRALAIGAKIVDDLIADAFFGMDYSGATGRQRDAWGALIGEYRGGLDETRYRAFMEARILVNTTDGTMPGMLGILALLFPSRAFSIRPMPPNGAAFITIGGALEPAAIQAHMGGLGRDYQPVGHLWYIGIIPDNAIEFDIELDEWESRLIPELLFGGHG